MPCVSSMGGVYGYGRSASTATTSLVTSGLVIQLDAYNAASYPGTGTSITDITGGYTL